jgi:hypothetical protein
VALDLQPVETELDLQPVDEPTKLDLRPVEEPKTAGFWKSTKAAIAEAAPFVGKGASEQILGGEKSWFDPEEVQRSSGMTPLAPPKSRFEKTKYSEEEQRIREWRRSAQEKDVSVGQQLMESIKESPKRIAKALIQTPFHAATAAPIIAATGGAGELGPVLGFSALGGASEGFQADRPENETTKEKILRYAKPTAKNLAFNSLLAVPGLARGGRLIGKAKEPTDIAKVEDAVEVPKTGEVLAPEGYPIIPKPEELVGKLPTSEKAVNLNLTKLNAPEETKGAMEILAETNRPLVEATKRNKVTFEEIRKASEEFGFTPKDVSKIRVGTTLNAEQLTALRRLNVTNAQEMLGIAKKAVTTGSLEDQANAMSAIQQQIMIQSKVGAVQSEIGRALVAQKIKVSPEDRTAQAFERVINTWGGKPKVERILNAISKMDPNDPKSINRFIQDASKSTFNDKLYYVWMNAILSGPKTHVVNTVSNAVTALTTPVERAFSAAIQAPKALWGGQRTRYLGESVQSLKGMGAGVGVKVSRWVPDKFVEWFPGFTNGVKTWLESGLPKTPEFGMLHETSTQIPPISGKLGDVIGIPGKMLGWSDDAFKTVNYGGTLYSNAYRKAALEGLSGKALRVRQAELIKNPTEELVSEASQDAIYRTFQQELGPNSKIVSHLRSIDIAGFEPLKYVVPFIRTPINIMKYGLERTPLNFIRLGYKGIRGQLGPEAADEIGRAAMGSAVAAAVIGYKLEGKITGYGPTDPRLRNAWLSSGNKPYSFIIGGKSYQYNRIEPVGAVVSMVSDAVDLHDVMESEDAARIISMAIGRNITSKTYMQGLSNLMNAMSDPERYGTRYVSSMAGSVVPGAVAQTKQAFDPTLRRPRSPLEAIKARTPGLGEDVPVAYTIWGETVKLGDENWIKNLLSPVATGEISKDKATTEVVRLGVKPGSPQRKLGKMELTDQEYDQYARSSGQLAHQLITKIVNRPNYDSIPDETKRGLFDDLFSAARETAKNRLLMNAPTKKRYRSSVVVETLENLPKTDKVTKKLEEAQRVLRGE